ncbi:MAG: hypothetical protein LBO72_08310 [Helicobacteraceae bacterium]|jgi:alpha-tubulin suppressor-like RCC1 family protein|nr:hypothetical protein [Helicobacteraceae bacterium]
MLHSPNQTTYNGKEEPRASIARVVIFIAAFIAVIAYFAERSFRYYFGYENHVKIENKLPFIAAGGFSSFFIDKNGKVYAAGANKFGELGLGDDVNRSSFISVSSLSDKNVIAIASTYGCSLALDADGKVYAAGKNKNCRFDLGDNADRKTFAPVSSLEGKKIVAIAAGDYHSLALSDEGKVYATGVNEYGQLGLNDYDDREVFTLVSSLSDKRVVAIAAGRYHSLALDNRGKVYATGGNKKSQLGLGGYNNRKIFTFISSLGGKNIAAISAGTEHSLALDSGGKVYAAGENSLAQLGFDDTKNRNTFTLVSSLSDKKIITIVASGYSSLALDSVGKVYAAGGNFYGQLGLGYYDSFDLVYDLSYDKIISVAMGGYHSLAIGADGKLYATGHNGGGQLGLGDNEHCPSFTPVSSFIEQ